MNEWKPSRLTADLLAGCSLLASFVLLWILGWLVSL